MIKYTKATVVKSFYWETDSRPIENYIKIMIRNGYQYRDCQGANDGQYHSTWIVVMEKY